MYASINFKTKKEFKEAVKKGERITLFAALMGKPAENGIEYVSGPWSPEPHRWYAQVTMESGRVVKVQ